MWNYQITSYPSYLVTFDQKWPYIEPYLGATEQIIGEAERSLHDALCVLTFTVKEPRTLYGGGCSEMLMAKAVDELAAVTPGKESRAMEGFANALRQLPSIIAENGGYDSAQLVSKLKAQHILG